MLPEIRKHLPIISSMLVLLSPSPALAISTSAQMYQLHFHKAEMAMSARNYASAENELLGAISFALKVPAQEDEWVKQSIDLAGCYEKLAGIQLKIGHRMAARDSLLKALHVIEKNHGNTSFEAQPVRNRLIDLYCKHRELQKAVSLYVNWSSKVGLGDAELIRLTVENQAETAKWPELRQAYCLAWLKRFGKKSKLWSEHTRSLIAVLVDTNQYAEACPYIKEFLRSYSFREVKFMEQSIAWKQWIKCLEKQGKYDYAARVNADYKSRVVYAGGGRPMDERWTLPPAEDMLALEDESVVADANPTTKSADPASRRKKVTLVGSCD